jgi:hypothetical protein
MADIRLNSIWLIIGLGFIAAFPTASTAEAVKTITLTQTGCQFLEPESIDHQYKTSKASDCTAINDKTGDSRVEKAKPLVLSAGKYIFKVTNKNVPYVLGFYLRGKGFSRVTLPSVSGGGINTGTTIDYTITLKPGKYVYSCPLNPTPDYPILVK